MKRSRIAAIALLVATAALHSPPAEAQKPGEKGAFGAGLMLGEPTGIAVKLYLGGDSDLAVAAAVGPALGAGGLHVHADLLWHPWILTKEPSFVLPAYVGVGIRLLDHARDPEDDDFHIGPRAVGGILFDFTEVPIDVFAEVAGVLEYRTGGSDPDHEGMALALNAGIGARYYF
jgi:hypothetical protein